MCIRYNYNTCTGTLHNSTELYHTLRWNVNVNVNVNMVSVSRTLQDARAHLTHLKIDSCVSLSLSLATSTYVCVWYYITHYINGQTRSINSISILGNCANKHTYMHGATSMYRWKACAIFARMRTCIYRNQYLLQEHNITLKLKL